MKSTDDANTLITRERLAELRYELRTPIQLLVGYCTTMLEDAGALVVAHRRAAVEAAREAAREALSIIDRTLPVSRLEVPSEHVAALYESLRGPQQRVARALATLFGAETLHAKEPAVRTSRESGVVSLSPPAQEAPARILLADDQRDMRLALQRVLKREGYIAECAENGRAALDMAARQPYDLILLDITMPEIDGYETLGRLKDAAETRDIPVLMISAVDDLQSVARCIERGAEDHLSKPFQPVLLRARVRACLEKKRSRDLEKEYLQRVNQVIDAASAVESGTYQADNLSQVAARSDELGRLARVFDKMATEVKTREQRLVKQVRDLKSEIEKASPEARQVRRSSRTTQSVPELFAGQLFAERYEILEEVGSGGMGVVYKAHDRKLDEDVAIKRLDPELLERSASLVERFKSEIRLARRISHRNVVRTHDFGEWDGTYYLTMEYVEGITVRELIDTRGQVGISSALAIGSQLAQSLDVAHKEGVIHRDIKPANLLLDEGGVLKVMDFGVACLAERTSSLTKDGTIVGTPAYMAPEQLLGGDVDARSDLYSAGVVLYECLTGSLPFEADDSTSLIMKVLEEEPPGPSTVNKDVPPSFSALVLHLLALRPDHRLGSAAELADQLGHIA